MLVVEGTLLPAAWSAQKATESLGAMGSAHGATISACQTHTSITTTTESVAAMLLKSIAVGILHRVVKSVRKAMGSIGAMVIALGAMTAA